MRRGGLRAIGHRVYADFLMPDRLAAYEALLASALAAGFQVLSVEAFWARLRRGLEPGARYLVLRHDVDTDCATAGRMWLIAQGLGIAPSFYFRLSTVDVPLMRAIAAGGGEASYHFEEIATVAKERGLKSAAAARRALPEMRERFAANLVRLRAETGLPMRVVASHGDFVNRKLGVCNWELLADPGFREAVGVELEVYDAALTSAYERRFSDSLYPAHWVPEPPAAAFPTPLKVIAVLVHPRHWCVSRTENARDNLVRVWEGVRHALA